MQRILAGYVKLSGNEHPQRPSTEPGMAEVQKTCHRRKDIKQWPPFLPKQFLKIQHAFHIHLQLSILFGVIG